MAFKVRVSPAVAAKRNGKGTRRRGGVEWSRQWTTVDKLPEGVADDPHLEVVDLEEGKKKKSPTGGGNASTGSTTTESLPPIPDDLSALDWPELQKLGGKHGVTGKKKEILAGLEAKRAASPAATAEGDTTTTQLRPERLGEE